MDVQRRRSVLDCLGLFLLKTGKNFKYCHFMLLWRADESAVDITKKLHSNISNVRKKRGPDLVATTRGYEGRKIHRLPLPLEACLTPPNGYFTMLLPETLDLA